MLINALLALAAAVAAADSPQYLGCYQDSNDSRDLPHPNCNPGCINDSGDDCKFAPGHKDDESGYLDWDQMSVARCASICKDYKYFSLQFRDECWCGDSYGNPGHPKSNDEKRDCNTPCSGDKSTMCGGGNFWQSIYATGTSIQVPNWAALKAAIGEYLLSAQFSMLSAY